MDYNVITVWECEIKEDFDHRMKLLIEEITQYKEQPLVGCSNGGYMTMGMVRTTGNKIVPLFDIMKLLIFADYIVIEYDTYKRGNYTCIN